MLGIQCVVRQATVLAIPPTVSVTETAMQEETAALTLLISVKTVSEYCMVKNHTL